MSNKSEEYIYIMRVDKALITLEYFNKVFCTICNFTLDDTIEKSDNKVTYFGQVIKVINWKCKPLFPPNACSAKDQVKLFHNDKDNYWIVKPFIKNKKPTQNIVDPDTRESDLHWMLKMEQELSDYEDSCSCPTDKGSNINESIDDLINDFNTDRIYNVDDLIKDFSVSCSC